MVKSKLVRKLRKAKYVKINPPQNKALALRDAIREISGSYEPNFADLTDQGYKKADQALMHTELILNSLGISLYDILEASKGTMFHVANTSWNSSS